MANNLNDLILMNINQICINQRNYGQATLKILANRLRDFKSKKTKKTQKSRIILYTDIPCGTYNILKNSKIAHFSVEMR